MKFKTHDVALVIYRANHSNLQIALRTSWDWKSCPRPHFPWLILTLGMFVQPVIHDDVIKWKDFPRYWPFVRGIHRSPVNSPHKGQWRGALMFSLICALNKRLSIALIRTSLYCNGYFLAATMITRMYLSHDLLVRIHLRTFPYIFEALWFGWYSNAL